MAALDQSLKRKMNDSADQELPVAGKAFREVSEEEQQGLGEAEEAGSAEEAPLTETIKVVAAGLCCRLAGSACLWSTETTRNTTCMQLGLLGMTSQQEAILRKVR
mgnify:CR=1 FL=1